MPKQLADNYYRAWAVVVAMALATALLLTACAAPPSSAYMVSTLVDAAGEPIRFNRPEGVAFDDDQNLYVVEWIGGNIVQVSPDGIMTRLLAEDSLSLPEKVAIDRDGHIYVSESAANRITRVVGGTLRVVAGIGERGYADGNASQAQFFLPLGIAVDETGAIYVADSGNDRIRKIMPDGQVSTLAGGERGFADGQGEAARFDGVAGLALDGNGNLYVAEARGARVRVITQDGLVSTLAGSGEPGFSDGAALAARFKGPVDVTVDDAGNIYVADLGSHSVRLITPRGQVVTIAGNGEPGYVDGPGTEARLRFPEAVAVDSAGVIYVADAGNNVIRIIKRTSLP